MHYLDHGAGFQGVSTRRYLLLPLIVTPDTPHTEALSFQSVHGHLVALFRTSRFWAIEHPDLALTDRQLAILADATGHWIRHATAKLLGQHAREQLGHASRWQTDANQAAEVQKHVARLRRLAEGEVVDKPLYELVAAPVEERVRWIKILIEATEADNPWLRQVLLEMFIDAERIGLKSANQWSKSTFPKRSYRASLHRATSLSGCERFFDRGQKCSRGAKERTIKGISGEVLRDYCSSLWCYAGFNMIRIRR